jgi:hypothetical protein
MAARPMRILLTLVLMLLPFGADAAEGRVKDIMFMNPGIYRSRTIAQTEAPETAFGFRNTVVNPTLEQLTVEIPGALGVRMGFLFAIVGEPNGATVRIDVVLRFPEPGLTDPATRRTHQSDRNSIEVGINDLGYQEYQFEDFWEIVPGIWTFEFWHEGKKLGEQRFKVILPGSV